MPYLRVQARRDGAGVPVEKQEQPWQYSHQARQNGKDSASAQSLCLCSGNITRSLLVRVFDV
jgi:hypothetical protein